MEGGRLRKNRQPSAAVLDKMKEDWQHMVTLYDSGVYLVNGTELVPEAEAAKVKALTGKDAKKEEARKAQEKYLKNLMEKGVQIIEKNVTIDKNAGVWKMKVDFLALEKTGITRKTQTAPLDESAEEENQE